MSVRGLVRYYSNLLILQYKDKPRAKAQVEAFVQEAIINLLPVSIRDSFDLTTAKGEQLDFLGKYIGVKRVNNGFTGPITLNDTDFYTLMKIAILSNNSGSSLFEIQNLLQLYFSGQVVIFDNKAMSVSYYMDSSIGTIDFAQVVVAEGLLPRPMGVGVSSVIYYNNTKKFFGMRSYELPAVNVTPFNDYAAYDTNAPWLNYDYALK